MFKKTITILTSSALLCLASTAGDAHGGHYSGGWGAHGYYNHGHGYYYGGGYRHGYYNNGWWVLPTAVTIASVAVIAASANHHYAEPQYIDNGTYLCQARYGHSVYQGNYQVGGPCYVNLHGRIFAFTQYRTLS